MSQLYIEEEYIREQFISNFLNKRHGNIIIYGTGIHTQRLLEKVRDPKIIGLMDNKKTGKQLWGYGVLSYEEVAKFADLNDISIVIIARNAVITVIYRRIEAFCKEHHIEVYDINGNNLHKSFPEDKQMECFCLDGHKLQEAIQAADIITFDIFDTLLTRCVMRPRDIFSVIDIYINSNRNGDINNYINFKKKEYRFSQERIKAEDSFPLGTNPTLADIYQQFQKNTGISDEERAFLMELEIATEKRFLIRRDQMCQLLEWASRLGKEVYLISDMYLPKETLRSLLECFHIKGYKDIFVSCEYGKAKQEGLFACFKEKVNTEEKVYLHIGDNYFSDIVSAQKAGFGTFRIFSAMEMFESSIYSKGLQYCCSLEENIVFSYFAARIYQNPFCSSNGNGKRIVDTTEEWIGLVAGPVIFKYIVWLIQNVVKNGHDLVLFPSRDGFLLERIYRLVKEKWKDLSLPEGKYFYTSRRAALVAAAETEKDVQEILSLDYSGNKAAMLKERFNIEIKKADRGFEESVPDLLDILAQCRKERARYMDYTRKMGLKLYRNIAILDFVAMGSVQESLQRLMGIPLRGYCFLRRSADKKRLAELDCKSLYPVKGDFQIEGNLYRYYYFLETILTSYEPTFRGVDQEGGLLFYPENRNKETIDFIGRVHTQILKVCSELLDLMPNILDADSSVEGYDFLLGLFSADYSELDGNDLSLLENVDEFMGRRVSEMNR